MQRWVWQHPDWPDFQWQADVLTPLVKQITLAQGVLLGSARGGSTDFQETFSLDAMLQNIVNSNAIEGETLNVESVRSSLARRLGLLTHATKAPEARSEGLAQILWDTTHDLDRHLDVDRLKHWHTLLFAGDDGLMASQIRIGAWRGPETMQVVSGRLDRPTIHFEAPPRDSLNAQITLFIRWFNTSQQNLGLDPLLRAGIAHFWLVTLHPFDDGNGRITRAMTDLALAQAEPDSIRFYAMSIAILADRKGYYAQLQHAQQGDSLDLTPWLEWFLKTLLCAIETASQQIQRVLDKNRFWVAHGQTFLSAEQIKVLNRLLDGDTPERDGFEQGISAAQYQAVAKVSKATATRHLADLVGKGCLIKLPGGGRNTRYQVVWAS